MISKFFKKSTPVHFVLVLLGLFVGFGIANYRLSSEVSILWAVQKLGIFIICFAALFVFEFFSSKNKLTQKNSYNLLFYGLFMLLMLQTLTHTKLIVAHFFILLALRRLVSLRSQKDVKKKILDAAIWISLASLFYFWSILFFVILYAALVLYVINGTKNWLIPVVGALSVGLIGCTVLILLGIPVLYFIQQINTSISLDFSALNTRQIIIGATCYLSYFVWASVYYLFNIKNKAKNYRPSYMLILLTAIIGLLIIGIAPEKTGAEFIFLVGPLALIVTNYVEHISEKWFREILIWLLIVATGFGLIL
ncbi:DUF6427 family protein [Bizionia sediminis]|uniref:DUF6427 family protein n=1 Tax=Bizionia sediminis TaxID=1737064 RepID=A0ABW5KUR5_9FLAO